MSHNVAVFVMLIICDYVKAPPPLRLTIDCPSDDNDTPKLQFSPHLKGKNSYSPNFDVESFCSLINSAIPKAVEDGRFILLEDRDFDQHGFGDALVPISVTPPAGFIPNFPKFKPPRLRIPKFKVPSLGLPDRQRQFLPPKVGPPMIFTARTPDEDSSAERMEKFKKAVQKMLHVVKVLGKVDQYLSERTRIIVEKISKTFAD